MFAWERSSPAGFEVRPKTSTQDPNPRAPGTAGYMGGGVARNTPSWPHRISDRYTARSLNASSLLSTIFT